MEFSDPQGVVDDLSSKSLRELTGFTKERLRSQLKHLKCLGLLHTVVPGVLRDRVLGTKPPIYYLNLRHPIFGAARRPGVMILFHQTERVEDHVLPNAGQQNFAKVEGGPVSEKSLGKFASLNELHSFEHLFFADGPSNFVYHHLESVICRMTSFLVSDSGIRAQFGKKIGFEFLSSMLDGPDESRRKIACNVLYSAAEMRLLELQTLVPTKIRLHASNLLVVPLVSSPIERNLTHVVEVFTNKQSDTECQCISITMGKEHKKECSNLLTAEQRKTFGFIDAQMLEKVKQLGDPLFDGSQSKSENDTA